MPPIKVYTESPINAAKASGITPKTAAVDDNLSPSSPTRTSSTPNQVQSQPAPTRTQPLPTQDNPPPPQPGAVPRLPEATPYPLPAHQQQQGGPAPPAPTAAPNAQPISGATYPPQMAIPPPQTAYNQRGTATVTVPVDYHRPTGYHSPQQQGWGGSNDSHSGTGAGAGYVPYGGNVGGSLAENEDREGNGVLSSAMKFAKAAGQRLSAAESEVWRRINGDS